MSLATGTPSLLWCTPAIAWRCATVLAVLLLTAYRAAVVVLTDLGLYVDESQYWLWAQSLDWGYFSKPPGIAAVIALSSAVFGDATPLAVKAGALLIHPLTAWGLFRLGERLADARTGGIAALLYLTAPGIALSQTVISTDVPLLACWVWAMNAVHAALTTGRLGYWLAGGLLGGMGLLSKYTMLMFLPSLVGLMALTPGAAAQWRRPGPWLAMGLAALLFAPHLLWNARMGWPTLRHTAELTGVVTPFRLDPAGLVAFVGAQFFVFGPVATAVWLRHARGLPGTAAGRWSLAFALPLVAVACTLALFSRAYANWAAPVILAISLGAAVVLAAPQRRHWLVAALGLNLLLQGLLYHLPVLWRLTVGEPPAVVDLARRARGWDVAAETVARVAAEHPQTLIVASDRQLLAGLAYHARETFPRVRAWHPGGPAANHFALTRPWQPQAGEPVLFVALHGLDDAQKAALPDAVLIYAQDIPIARNRSLALRIYRATP